MHFPEVGSREEFVEFLAELRRDLRDSPGQWETANLADFMESLGAWLIDKDVESSPEAWRLLAQSLFAGSRYE
jgi:hypothetical protein